MSQFIYTPSALVQGSLLTTGAVAYFTASDTSDSVGAIIKELWLTNTGAADVAVTIYVVPLGGSAGAANCIMSAVNVPVGMPFPFSCWKTMGAGASIFALAATGSVIALSVSGMEITTV